MPRFDKQLWSMLGRYSSYSFSLNLKLLLGNYWVNFRAIFLSDSFSKPVIFIRNSVTITKHWKNYVLAHQSDFLLKSAKLENLHAASRYAQNEFKQCILDPKTNELCFKGKITLLIPFLTYRDRQLFLVSKQNFQPKTLQKMPCVKIRTAQRGYLFYQNSSLMIKKNFRSRLIDLLVTFMKTMRSSSLKVR